MSAKIISISITQDLDKELEKFCEEQERSKSYCVRKALEKFLEEEKKKKGKSKK